LEAAFNCGICNAAPELFLLLSLLFNADNVLWLPSRAVVLVEALPTVVVVGTDGVEPKAGGKAGFRLGGEAVEMVGLKVTLRGGRVGRGAEAVCVERRGEVSEVRPSADEAIVGATRSGVE
jgi:hypothetical protein